MKLIAIFALLVTLVSCGGNHCGKGGHDKGGFGGKCHIPKDGEDGAKGDQGDVGNSNPLIEYFSNDESERHLGTYYGKETSGELEVLGVHTTTTGFDQAAPVNQNQAVIKIQPKNGTSRYFLVDLTGFPPVANFTPSDVYNYITSSTEVWYNPPQLYSGEGHTSMYRNTSVAGDATEFYFSEDSDTSKDLESMGAKSEALEVADMEDTLINYGLSAERAETLGKLMTSYSKIKNKRGLTAREKDVFTKELTGLSFDKASEVLVDEGYDALIDRASEVNGADPEALKELLNQVL